MVRAGDLVVEFDRQDQLKNALDRRVELNDLEQQIRKKQAEGGAARAKDDSELMQAESALGRAQLEILKNEMLPKIQAEKNTQALEEAQAKVKQLKTTYELKRKAAEADLRILQIRRDRAENAMHQAESNADRMAIKSPIGGMAVLRSIWKSNNMAEVQEGEEVRSGMPIVDVVNPASMRVRAKVNQADIGELKPGLSVRIGLDAYPDLSFTGRVSQISPLAVTSTLSPKVRNFIALIAVDGAHPNLMPDLTASLDVETAAPARRAGRAARRAAVRRRAGVRARAPRQRRQRSDGHGGRHERARSSRDVRARRWRSRRTQYSRREPGLTMTAGRRVAAMLRTRPKSAIAVLLLIGLGITATFVRARHHRRARTCRCPRSRAGSSSTRSRSAATSVPSSRSCSPPPMQSGDLQIVKLAANGSIVKAGDVVVVFDASTLQRTMQEKQSELKQANAEIEQASAQARITQEQNATRVDAFEVQHPARPARRQQGRHGLAHRERAGQADAQGQRAEAAGARGQGHLRRDLERSGPRRASSASARRPCSISSAPSVASRTCSCGPRPPGWSTC